MSISMARRALVIALNTNPAVRAALRSAQPEHDQPAGLSLLGSASGAARAAFGAGPKPGMSMSMALNLKRKAQRVKEGSDAREDARALGYIAAAARQVKEHHREAAGAASAFG